LNELATWLTTGLLRAVIDSRYELSSVHEAFARLESKRTRGKIIIELQ
jgi:NADPH:quinone reductase-like Zn-dependent oxidoreductase